MLSLISGLIVSLFPSLASAFVDAYKARLAADNDAGKTAADLAGRELAVQQRELELAETLRIAQIGKWYEPEHLFGYTLWVYFAKIILWDKVLALGSTDPLTGSVAAWAGAIVGMYFGKRAFENVARIIRK